MTRILIWGIIIGITSGQSWHIKVISALLLGLYACVELFFLMRKKKFNPIEAFRLKLSGHTKEEIEKLGDAVFKGNKMMIDDLGMNSIKIYISQFTRYFIGTLVVAFIVGFITDMF